MLKAVRDFFADSGIFVTIAIVALMLFMGSEVNKRLTAPLRITPHAHREYNPATPTPSLINFSSSAWR